MNLVEKYHTLVKDKLIEPCTPEYFFKKYQNVNTEVISTLKEDLHRVFTDVLWIQESNNKDEPWAIDFADAINNISTRI